MSEERGTISRALNWALTLASLVCGIAAWNEIGDNHDARVSQNTQREDAEKQTNDQIVIINSWLQKIDDRQTSDEKWMSWIQGHLNVPLSSKTVDPKSMSHAVDP